MAINFHIQALQTAEQWIDLMLASEPIATCPTIFYINYCHKKNVVLFFRGSDIIPLVKANFNRQVATGQFGIMFSQALFFSILLIFWQYNGKNKMYVKMSSLQYPNVHVQGFP